VSDADRISETVPRCLLQTQGATPGISDTRRRQGGHCLRFAPTIAPALPGGPADLARYDVLQSACDALGKFGSDFPRLARDELRDIRAQASFLPAIPRRANPKIAACGSESMWSLKPMKVSFKR